MYLPLLQLIGNSALERYLLPLSTMQMSQQPKMGPLSGLLAMANCARFRLNFQRMFKEKMKDFRDLSAAHCFFAELQAMGVQPPMIFPNSVSAMVTVPPCPSHFLWNSLMEKLFSLARKMSFSELTLFSKSRWMAETSWTILLLKPLPVALISGMVVVVGACLSRFVPGFRYRSLVRSSSSLISSCRPTISLSISVGISTFLAWKISLMMGLMQLPLTWLKLFSVRFLMNFMTSMLQPQVFTQILNLACYVLILLMRVRNMLSILSRTQWKSGERRLGLSQIWVYIYDHFTLLHPQWKRLHSYLLAYPLSHIRPGFLQFGFVQTAKQGLPQMHSGPTTLGSADISQLNISEGEGCDIIKGGRGGEGGKLREQVGEILVRGVD